MDEISFDIPATPETVKAMEELKKQFFDSPCTLYGEDENGNIFPVANVSKHPDCPNGWYEATLKKFLNYREDSLGKV